LSVIYFEELRAGDTRLDFGWELFEESGPRRSAIGKEAGQTVRMMPKEQIAGGYAEEVKTDAQRHSLRFTPVGMTRVEFRWRTRRKVLGALRAPRHLYELNMNNLCIKCANMRLSEHIKGVIDGNRRVTRLGDF
jgi:hypothetical protein